MALYDGKLYSQRVSSLDIVDLKDVFDEDGNPVPTLSVGDKVSLIAGRTKVEIRLGKDRKSIEVEVGGSKVTVGL